MVKSDIGDLRWLLGEFWPDRGPVVGAKIAAGYGASGGALDRGAMFDGYSTACLPHAGCTGRDANHFRQTGDPADNLNSFQKGIHMILTYSHDSDSTCLTNVSQWCATITSVKTIAERLKSARDEAGLTQPQLAARAGVSAGTIGNIESGARKNPRELLAIAKAVGVLPQWLRDGTGPRRLDVIRSNVSEGPFIKGLVPLLTSVQAGEWCEIAGSFQREDAMRWLPCPVSHSSRTFCLLVEGESMRNPGHRPSYDPGDVIFVDPEVPASPGDRVVARLEGQEKATFKQYLEEDGRKLLKALNPDWNPRYIEINGNAVICGVVIGKWVPE